jgi:YD repeat-containing protein
MVSKYVSVQFIILFGTATLELLIMTGKRLLVFAAFIAGILTTSKAQYYDITHRQSNEEVQKYRNQRIQMVTISLSEASTEVPFGLNRYDTMGHIVLIANPKHHEHFIYDADGRMIYWLDSANDGRRFEKTEYNFGYDAGGKMNSFRTKGSTSSFMANGAAEIKEEVMKNGVLAERHSYTFTPENKPALEEFKDTSGKQLYFHKLLYNKYGDLSSEIVVNPVKRCAGDSSTHIYTYDSKARMIQQNSVITTFSCDLRVPGSPVTKTTVSQNTSYVYDNRGRLVTETMTSSNSLLNYRKEFQYNDENLLAKELTFDSKGRQSKSLIYKYYYFKRKK